MRERKRERDVRTPWLEMSKFERERERDRGDKRVTESERQGYER